MDNIDFQYSQNLTRNQVVAKYLQNLQQLKDFAVQNCQINEKQFDNFILVEHFNYSATNFVSIKSEILKQILDRKRKILFWIFYLFIAFLCISYKNEASTIILRNIQTFIYPGMKMWRKMTLPLLSKFPGLTELYDESCLIMNPFFQIEDLNCEPCSRVVNVLDLTNVAIDKKTEFVPFIFKIKQNAVYINDLYELYHANKEVFRSDAYRIYSTNKDVTNLDELFSDFNRTQQTESHNLWRCNRMPPARILRQVLIRPDRLPKTGISLERHLSIDTPEAPSYAIPDAECSNMFVQQILGTRLIILRPTSECRHKCRTLSVRLPQSFVLSYNWWYWRPISAPDQMTKSNSISLIGSYC